MRDDKIENYIGAWDIYFGSFYGLITGVGGLCMCTTCSDFFLVLSELVLLPY